VDAVIRDVIDAPVRAVPALDAVHDVVGPDAVHVVVDSDAVHDVLNVDADHVIMPTAVHDAIDLF
jgi:hypothetical protein